MELIIAIIGLIGSLITVIGVLLSFFNIRKKRKNAINRNLSSLGTDAFETIHTDNFIPTMGQDEDPNEEPELKGQDESINKIRRFLLSKELLDVIKSEKNSVKKLRFFVLGGSGMGKTSFLAYFIEKYYKQYLFSLPPNHVHTIYLGSPNCLNDIKSIERNDSILILDALDENASAVKDVTTFINEMEAVTDRFRFVIISSRTQFFSDRANIPNISTIIQNGGAGNNLYYKIYYISPFDEVEINKYLSKKFGEYTDNYIRANNIVEKCNTVMVRPMVLNFIDYLLKLDTYRRINSSEIYQAIIDKWFEREIDICGNRVKIKKEDLYSFSKKFAFYIYEQWINCSITEVTQEEYISFVESYGYNESPYSFKERSLLSRRDDGSVKFSHRSFWEFFMAINAIEQPGVGYSAIGMDMARSFYREIIEMNRSKLKLNCVNPYIPHILIGVGNLIPGLEKNERDFIFLSQKGNNVEYDEVLKAFYSLWETIIQLILYKRFYFYYKLRDNLKATEDILDVIEALQPLNFIDNMNKIKSLYEEDIYVIYTYCYKVLCSIKEKKHDLVGVVSIVLKRLQDTVSRIKDDFSFYYKEKNEVIVFPESQTIKFYREGGTIKDNTIDDLIIIGTGFNDENTVISFINDLCSDKNNYGLETVCVYKKIKTIKEAVNYLRNLHNGTSTEKDIFTIFDIDDNIFFYVSNDYSRKYSLEVEIERVIKNMIMLKNSEKETK